MINIVQKDKCTACQACFNICPKNAISMIYDNEGFLYPKVNMELCVNCGLCSKVCPINKKRKTNNQGIAYLCMNKDINVKIAVKLFLQEQILHGIIPKKLLKCG